MANRKYPRVTLRALKYAAFQSHETHCFEATIYLDGKKAGTADDDGNGGMVNIHPQSLRDQLDAYGKTFPDDNSHGITISIDAEIIIRELVNDWLLARDVKRDLAKKVMYTVADDDGLYETKAIPGLAQHVAKGEAHMRNYMRNFKRPPVKILNLLPLEEAVELYRKAAGE